MMDFAIDRAVDLVQACDAWDIKINRWERFGRDYAPPAFHLYGTCRMGVDPETSVTNEFGQSWEVPNLFVMDGSLMPTGGALNPADRVCTQSPAGPRLRPHRRKWAPTPATRHRCVTTFLAALPSGMGAPAVSTFFCS